MNEDFYTRFAKALQGDVLMNAEDPKNPKGPLPTTEGWGGLFGGGGGGGGPPRPAPPWTYKPTEVGPLPKIALPVRQATLPGDYESGSAIPGASGTGLAAKGGKILTKYDYDLAKALVGRDIAKSGRENLVAPGKSDIGAASWGDYIRLPTKLTVHKGAETKPTKSGE